MTAEKKEKLIELVEGFSDEYLDDEFKKLNVKLVEKLGRKRDMPFKRGKLENWAGGIVYAIGQINFLFDDSFNPYATPDDISNYFGVKKKTAANKARDIRKLLNLKLGDEEFSTELVLQSDVSRLGGDLSQVKTLSGARTYSRLRHIGDMMKIVNSQNPNRDLETFIDNIEDYNLNDDELEIFYELVRDTEYIVPHHNDLPVIVSNQDGVLGVAVFTSDERYCLDEALKTKRMSFMKVALFFSDKNLDGIVINHGSQNIFLFRDQIREAIFGR